jgi:hypothetical protein
MLADPLAATWPQVAVAGLKECQWLVAREAMQFGGAV